MTTQETRNFFDSLNHDYLAVHHRKENLFWETYMAISDDQAAFTQAESDYKAFISDPAKLQKVDAALAALEALPAKEAKEAEDLRKGLQGWKALFSANVVTQAEAQEDMNRIVSLEAQLFGKRASHILRHIGGSGVEEETTLGGLLVNEATNPSEAARRSSLETLRGLEQWVLENGFLDIVKARNAFARDQGFESYFDYKVRKSESMSSEELFEILGEFESRTRLACQRGLEALVRDHGPSATLPWNIRYYMSGDVLRDTDPYYPYQLALDRWTKSFRRLGIGFRGAVMQLDLLERRGKYQNGFCHGPVPSFYDRGIWVPAHVNFTSEGRPSQVGSGQRALETLFHEGGHAAHFSNVTQNSPCFSQEFPPTSMAYAETQSMFCDSILGDADWLSRYALDIRGNPMPRQLIRKMIEANQPSRAYMDRMILVVAYFERDLYALPDAQLLPETVLALARAAERKILGAESSRPLLAIPHLLNQESAASYHGYLLAEMAVQQTRSWFMDEYGYIADNPAVGLALAQHYWGPGNSLTHSQTLKSLTGEGFNPRYRAEACNASVEEAWAAACELMDAAKDREYPEALASDLDADIRIVHGALVYADNAISEEKMCEDFAAYVADLKA